MSSLYIALVLATFSSVSGFSQRYPVISRVVNKFARGANNFNLYSTEDEMPVFEDRIVTSDEIVKLRKKIETINASIETVRAERTVEEAELAKLDAEFGDEILRIKKEFARIKERSVEEAVEISNKAKIDALKEVLPITDNYYRAKSVYEPITEEGELKVVVILLS